MLEFLFIDLDNTILDFQHAERAALHQTLPAFGLEPTEAVCSRYSEINREYWRCLERQELTREQVVVGRFAALFEELGIAVDAVAVARSYEYNLAHAGHQFLPGALETLQQLSQNYKLYMASNGTASVQWVKLEALGIKPYFQDIFISEEMGADKPSPDYFRACFEKIPGFDPKKAMMVGDSLSADIRGGIHAGIATCWVNTLREPPRPDIRPDYEVQYLAELLPILEKE